LIGNASLDPSGGTERDDEFEQSPNPELFKPHPAEHPAAAKARLFAWHYARGSMGTYYDLYPEDRPAEAEPHPARSRGQSR
jgi:hypothetical protein